MKTVKIQTMKMQTAPIGKNFTTFKNFKNYIVRKTLKFANQLQIMN
jgi:hypothetical protein